MFRFSSKLTGLLLALPLFAPTAALAAGAPADGKTKPSGGLLNVQMETFIWTILLFIIVVVVLSKFVWPKILDGLRAREASIEGNIAEANKANDEAQKTLEEYKQKLNEAHAEARQLVESSKKEAEQLRAKIAAETEQEIARMRERATNDIRLAKQQAVQDLYAQAGTLATAVAGKILQREVTGEDTQRLVEESLKELDNVEQAG